MTDKIITEHHPKPGTPVPVPVKAVAESARWADHFLDPDGEPTMTITEIKRMLQARSGISPSSFSSDWNRGCGSLERAAAYANQLGIPICRFVKFEKKISHADKYRV